MVLYFHKTYLLILLFYYTLSTVKDYAASNEMHDYE
jgi:hypothetical protein